MEAPNILLIGPRGCGKTTVGRLLAAMLERPFVDLDEVTAGRLGGLSAREIWEKQGEHAWRRAESEALAEALRRRGQVIALGGGTPTIAECRARLGEERRRATVMIVYLRCAAAELKRRLREGSGDRPALRGDDPVAEVEAVLALRSPTYQALADLIVAGDAQGAIETARCLREALTSPG